MGHRFTKDERAEGHAAARVGAKVLVDLLWSTSKCSTICALDGGKIDRCLVNNYFLRL